MIRTRTRPAALAAALAAAATFAGLAGQDGALGAAAGEAGFAPTQLPAVSAKVAEVEFQPNDEQQQDQAKLAKDAERPGQRGIEDCGG